MAEDINSSASFGQHNNNGEELPIIVAQRFLNIFRQLHIFSNERREAFNKMLLELPQEVKNIFQSLPGGTPLQEYMEDLEQKSKGLEPVAHHEHKKNTNILQEALESQRGVPMGSGTNVISGDFAKILAASLAQSNAEIIKELQNSRPAVMGDGKGGAAVFDGSMKLIADESFTNIISKALAEAIENSEKKRLEDNKMIAQSFMELQENLTKLIEQNSGQMQFAATGEKGGIVPVKGIVDDLVKAQSEFLKETTKNQKDEISSIISTAIKESQKVSTQALIDSFKQIGSGNAPAPITYAAASPKGGAPAIESVEQALKAQGKEFSSIISMAIKESQKNSAQTIAETIESLKKDTSFGGGQNNLKVEEIMRMQANLFRDIARAQNQEFSALISAALKESQKQSTQAIIAALEQLQSRPVQTVAVPMPMPASTIPTRNADDAITVIEPVKTVAPIAANVQNTTSESVATPFIDKYMADPTNEDEEDDDEEKTLTEAVEEAPKKKKKKKKKKNKGNNGAVSENQQSVSAEDADVTAVEKSEKDEKVSTIEDKKVVTENSKAVSTDVTTIDKGTVKEEKIEKKETSAAKSESTEVAEKATPQLTKTETAIETKSAAPAKPQTSMLEKLMTISTAFSAVEDIKDNDIEDWGWGTVSSEVKDNSRNNTYSQDYVNNASSSAFQYDDDSTPNEAYGNEQDWEWEYEEVPADAEMSGEEGQDWEWEYEEVPADIGASGEEAQDWGYEDAYAEDGSANGISAADKSIDGNGYEDEYEYDYQESVLDNSLFHMTAEEFAENSEITLDHLPQLVLLGLEDENFRDPYIENSDNIG